MNTGAKSRPIAVMSFDRPHYLEPVLRSLRAQTVPISPDEVILFQDGYRSKSGRDLTDPRLIERCVELFKTIFPGGRTFLSTENLGVALNFARAENHCFEELGAEAAFFFEDDLVLSPHYLTALWALTDMALPEQRIGYVAAYGDHRAKLGAQRENQRKLVMMGHKWGFALMRRQWEAQRQIMEPYLEIVRRADYRSRDHAAIRHYFRELGYGSPGTSQDAMKDVASFVLGSTKVMTFACLGRYIGEVGQHFTKIAYDEAGFGETELYPHEITSFTPSSRDELEKWIAATRTSAKALLRDLADPAPLRSSSMRATAASPNFHPLSTPDAAYGARVKLIVGAASTSLPGWVATDQDTLDLLKPQQWRARFADESVQAILAEHVWEHLSADEGMLAANVCFRFLSPGGRLRIAVPDGYQPDPEYIDYVSRDPGHKVLYNVDTLTDLLHSVGFQIRALEFFDSRGEFNETFWSPLNGLIMRSRHRDHRNRGGVLRYTSLIVDAIKPSCTPIDYKFALGEATSQAPGWQVLDPREFLEASSNDLKAEYAPCGRPAVVTEHWVDKLSPGQIPRMLAKLYDFLAPGARARIAVRDAHFPSEVYHRSDPKHPAISMHALSDALRAVGFHTVPLEWFDQNGQFHREPWSPDDGFISRSARFDRRNKNRELHYTSVIVDAVKPAGVILASPEATDAQTKSPGAVTSAALSG
jgi:predicted SAM-dependent methyltransferase